MRQVLEKVGGARPRSKSTIAHSDLVEGGVVVVRAIAAADAVVAVILVGAILRQRNERGPLVV